ncbi:cyclohexanecarboxylate-CoA ligase [Sphaerisporangium melleum]|uniref:Cyclohexanecarboxylate-CoA ligase n=1 Tax=Sphaerisporangium melleum TaxID=321316 RepID=A0A917VRU6_9ACTN|nr:AMP-binding protein [Sphaerisporangium melleum]GGL11500.1 cyclohexanecarboxylate-CoA ligase [Sphaerisporangium melleum]GII71727.1 cyclohexanecarboxylate-CoA ligase [Sphaerisporangium melleum]
MTAPAATPPHADAARYRERGWWREETFLDDLFRQARERPHKQAIAGRRIAEARTDTLDYAELARLTDRFAGALLDLGVQRGDFVAVQLPNRWEMAPLIFACARVGAVICPISPICPESELRHRFELTEARVAITVAAWQDTPLASDTTRLKDELSTLEQVFVVDGPVPEGARGFHDHFVAVDWEERRRHDLEGLALGPDDPFVVLFTSGTTGESKGVLHSQNTIYAAVRRYVDAFGLGEDWVAALSTPLCHYSGFAQGILAGVMLGATITFQDVRKNEALLDLVERYGATLLYGPPATIADVTAAQRSARREVSSLRHVVVGTAQVLQELIDEVRDLLGARTYSLWGMSEIGPVTVTRPDDPDDWAADSNGRPIDSMELRIDGPDGEPAPVGRLRVRGASLALGYYKRDDVFAAEFGRDGWFDTGDLARDDGRGGIRILGRARDAIVREGVFGPITAIEAVIGGHPKVTEAAVVGLPSAEGEEICAVVVPRDAARPSFEEITGHLRAAGVDERFIPERIVLIDALPKTLTGKVRKAELRQRYARA